MIFENLNKKAQVEFNIIFEEICCLLLEISKDILLDFQDYLEKFVNIKPPKLNKLEPEVIYNESESFTANIKLFNEIILFLKGCFEVYKILVRQVDDMIMKAKQFEVVKQFLSRARYNLSSLKFKMQVYTQIYREDEKIYDHFKYNKLQVEAKIALIKGEIDSDEEKKYTKEIQKRKDLLRPHKLDFAEKVQNQFSFKKNENNEKQRRLNFVLYKSKMGDDTRNILKAVYSGYSALVNLIFTL